MAEDGSDLPYRAEYAKSGRAKCKGCKAEVPKGDCRLASMTQSAFFDGKQANWFHLTCFFGRNRPQAVGEFAHFEQLRWEDQEKIRKRIEDKTGAVDIPTGGKGKGKKGKGRGDMEMVEGTIIKDFRTEYAKSGAAKCRTCEEKIPKGDVRIAKKDFEDERAKMYGPMDRWHHAKCFSENRETLEYFASADQLTGLKTLKKEDQIMLKEMLPKMKRKLEKGSDEPDSKKPKMEVKEEPEDKEEMKKQNKKMFYYRDLLQKHLKKKELEELLEYNKQEIPVGQDRMLDRLCDVMTFGCLTPCKECSGGQFVYQSGVGYKCLGDLTEWTKCTLVSLNPERTSFKVPTEFKEKFDFLSMYKGKTGVRLIANLPGGVPKKETNGSFGQGSSTAALLPLRNMTFVFSGKFNKEKLQKKIEALGGKVGNRVDKDTVALVADKETLAEARSKVRDAKKDSVLVVGQEFITVVKAEGVATSLKQHALSDWGVEEVQEKVNKAHNTGHPVKQSSTMFQSKSMPKSVKLKLKGGGYVDPDSGLEDKAHVYKIKDAVYSVVLGSVNVQDGKNSYYKLQVLQHDKKKKWYVFRAWGRVGTTIGGNKLQDFEDLHEAVRDFEFLYEEKTGNRWKNRKEFKKLPGKFYPLEIDMGETLETKLDLENSKSLLPKPIKELITLIFDIESMKRAMVEFEIDLTKMPLGKLSKAHVQKAYGILTEVQDMIKNESGSEAKFIDATNRFFTLIPHDFGMKSPPLLDNADLVKSKIDMLDNLLEIEVAYNLLSTEDSTDKDPIDVHYERLNTDVSVLEKEAEEFKILQDYVTNTHASTHTQYSLEIEQIFKVKRKNEEKRFKPFKALPNRTLLWHGSRTTNFAGILSQGLRIAPPEAPVTGYMFGKGLYFADMVSKSANYCCTNRTNNTGLLMLCDVALGNMYERTKADFIEKLPAGFHSTKGIGKTEPNPEVHKEMEGAKVPLGTGVKDATKKTDLLYNEFIVYDVAQVQCKYLMRMKFNYKV